MRIISKFSDYYDGVMAYGQDRTITWVRNTEEIKTDTSKLGISDSWFPGVEIKSRQHNLHVREAYVACAGKLYPIVSGSFSGWIDREQGYKRDLVISGNTYWEVRNRFHTLVGAIIAPRTDYKPHYGWKLTADSERLAWLGKPSHELHRHFDCPLLLIEQNKITKCPYLKAMKFQVIRDPFAVFQDIAQYISGVMGQQTNPVVTISDKSKIIKHGFDLKYGFRKRKGDSQS